MNNIILDSNIHNSMEVGLNKKKVLALTALIIGLSLMVLGYIYYRYINGYYAVTMIFTILILLILGLVKFIKYFNVFRFFKTDKPLLIFYKEGLMDNIALKHFIPWDRILDVSVLLEEKKTYLSIDVENIEEFVERLNRFEHFWLSIEPISSTRSYYTINAIFLDTNAYDIVEYFNTKIKEKRTGA
jgi:hypothetical protein